MFTLLDKDIIELYPSLQKTIERMRDNLCKKKTDRLDFDSAGCLFFYKTFKEIPPELEEILKFTKNNNYFLIAKTNCWSLNGNYTLLAVREIQ